MHWRPGVLRGRLRDQAPVVLMVTAVAVAATTLVGVLALLLHVAENDAASTTLARFAPEQVQLEATVWVSGEDAGAALERARDGLARITGDVPTTEETWQIGSLHTLPRGDGPASHLTYLAALPQRDDVVQLMSGRWPDAAAAQVGDIEVTVPVVAAETLGWQVGTVVAATPWGTQEARSWVVVGTYESVGPRSDWFRDRLHGDGVDHAFNIPGRLGRDQTVAWGPLVAAPEALAGPQQVDTTYLLVTPQLADAPADAVAVMRERVRDGGAILSESLGARTSGRLVTDVGATIDATWRELVVTRAGVVTIGLLLATLATTVMLLAARLLAERRAAESELLAARGASPAQLRSVVVLEAVALAGVTWLVAPWVALLVLERMARSGALADAGYAVAPTVPAPVLLACGAMAAVLAVALCVPAWHTAGSSTRTAHAGLLRAGGDLALVALGGLALWQLVVYGSPVRNGPTGPQLDPLLVTGPALVTLAAATVALRLVGPLGRGADLLAARARSFVVPLAAWQVARRSAVVTGTVLVVVVAVTTGTFSAAFHATWRTSQAAQVDLAVGTDLRVDGLQDDPLGASAVLGAATADQPDAVGQPVVDRHVRIGPRGGSSELSGRLVGIDTSRPQDVRGPSGSSWDAVLADLAVAVPATGTTAPVPAGTQWLTAHGVVATQPASSGEVLLSLSVEDDQGVVVQLPGSKAWIGGEFAVAFQVPDVAPLRITAVSAVVSVTEPPHEILDAAWDSNHSQPLPITVDVTAVMAVPRAAGIIRADVAAHAVAMGEDVGATVVEMQTGGWAADLRQSVADVDGGGVMQSTATVRTVDGAVHVGGTVAVDGYTPPIAWLTARAWPATPVVPAAVSRTLLRTIDVHAGQMLSLNVGGTPVDVRVQRLVDHVPGAPHGVSVLVDRTALTRALLDAGGQPGLVDAWWVAAPDTTVATIAARLPGPLDADVTTREGRRHEALSGPARVAVPAALSLAAAASALLVLVGTGAVAAASLRARRTELARLQALGASRRGLAGGLQAENALLVVIGAGVGLLAGFGLASAVAPLLTMSATGRTPVPTPWLVWHWPGQGMWTVAVVAGACTVVALVAGLGVRRASGAELRMGDDR